MSNSHFLHTLMHSFHHAKHMSPVGSDKNPAVAFLLGFLFGPFGVGLYLRSWPDFLITFFLVVVGAATTVGIGAPFFWVMCGFWGLVRASKSD